MLSKIIIFFIRTYQLIISPIFPSCCRFTPTCSEYGLIAFKKYPFIKASKLTLKRLIKCRPGGPYGYDPVP